MISVKKKIVIYDKTVSIRSAIHYLLRLQSFVGPSRHSNFALRQSHQTENVLFVMSYLLFENIADKTYGFYSKR